MCFCIRENEICLWGYGLGGRKKLKAESTPGPYAGPATNRASLRGAPRGSPSWNPFSGQSFLTNGTYEEKKDLSEKLRGIVEPRQPPEWRRRSCRLWARMVVEGKARAWGPL